jgi:hypothetical protein
MYDKWAIDKMCIFYNMKKLWAFYFVLFLGFEAPLWAESEDTSLEDHRSMLEEDLALVRDTYLKALTSAMEGAMETAPDHWFNMRAEGQYATWEDFEIEMPEVTNFEVTEAPYGFSIKSKVSDMPGSCSVRVVTRDMDIFYDLEFSKKAPEAFQERVRDVFSNDRAVYYDPSSPCTKAAVTCIDEYQKGTLGKISKKSHKKVK